MNSSQGQAGATRQCVHCGKPVRTHLRQCPFCREMIPDVPRTRRLGSDGGREIRRGLLYMLMAAVIYYFAGGYSDFKLTYYFPRCHHISFALIVFGRLGLQSLWRGAALPVVKRLLQPGVGAAC